MVTKEREIIISSPFTFTIHMIIKECKSPSFHTCQVIDLNHCRKQSDYFR